MSARSGEGTRHRRAAAGQGRPAGRCVRHLQNANVGAMIRDRRAILALLTALNLINYIDRAVIAAVLTPMKTQLALTNFEAGVLNTAFLIGYFATSPLFGLRADKGTRKRLIALGVVTW